MAAVLPRLPMLGQLSEARNFCTCNQRGSLFHCNLKNFQKSKVARSKLKLQVLCKGPSQGFTTRNNKNREKGKKKSETKQETIGLKHYFVLVIEENQAPSINVNSNGQNLFNKEEESNDSFEERLRAVTRSAEEKKRSEEKKPYAAIDYDTPAPTQDTKSGGNLFVTIGTGVAILVLGVVLVAGDFLPSGPVEKSADIEEGKLSSEEKANLQLQLKQFESLYEANNDNVDAVEGVAVTYAELGEYSKSATFLKKLLEKRPNDVEALRLYAEVQNALKNFQESASIYRNAIKVSKAGSFPLLKGLVETLFADGKPNEAVDEILAAKKSLAESEDTVAVDEILAAKKALADSKESVEQPASDPEDPVQVELLLGKAYIAWGHTGDAISTYDSLISTYPADFRGYLAKGILLGDQGEKGEAERMFIQARFLAPEKYKGFVNRYATGI